ncbi:hypothetical protein HK104_002998 [Borealophlyctis nickersoniae]|nr:hypothetical protein HK104_002998 [Borealophlyctis nickersoniae]
MKDSSPPQQQPIDDRGGYPLRLHEKSSSTHSFKEGIVAAAAVVKDVVKDAVTLGHGKDESFGSSSSNDSKIVESGSSDNATFAASPRRRGRSPSRSKSLKNRVFKRSNSISSGSKTLPLPSSATAGTGSRPSSWDTSPIGTIPLKYSDDEDAPVPSRVRPEAMSNRQAYGGSLSNPDMSPSASAAFEAGQQQRQVQSDGSSSGEAITEPVPNVPPVVVERAPSLQREGNGNGDEYGGRQLSRSPSRRAISSSSGHVSTRDRKKFIRVFPELEGEANFLAGTYTCALERDVLWQGKLYLSALHICFYGKIFAKAAKVIVHFKDVTGIEKKNTAGMFPNAIKVLAGDTKYVFTSFLKREAAYNDMIDIWRTVVSPLNSEERAILGLNPPNPLRTYETSESIPDSMMSDNDNDDGDGPNNSSSTPTTLKYSTADDGSESSRSVDTSATVESDKSKSVDTLSAQLRKCRAGGRRSLSGPPSAGIGVALMQEQLA